MHNNPIKMWMRNLRHCAGGQADRRGSAIVLVLVSIVLMAILAATLLQVTRFERIPRPASNIDIVIESVVEEIANQLTADIVDNSGNVFNTNFTATNGGGDEPWDFPYTNVGNPFTPNANLFGRQAEKIDGSKVNVYGGAMDDTWLAASAPDFRNSIATPFPGSVRNNVVNTTSGVWPKITSLTGLSLYGTGGSSDLSTVATPDEQPVNNLNNILNRDMNIPANHNSLVDADGDGIGDSRWEWAPLRQIGTTRYVMAVRVIDLSSRVDLNVAGFQSVDSTSLGLGKTRGDGPTEIDGSGMAGLTPGVSPADTINEYRRLLNFRLDTAMATIPQAYDGDQVNPSVRSRRHYWTKGAALVGNNFDRHSDPTYPNTAIITATDALELLHRNGLNSPTQANIETLMPNLLRDGGAEDNFITNGGTVTGYNWNQAQFWDRDLRKHYSPLTGANVYPRPIRPNQTLNAKIDIKQDVNKLVLSSAGLTTLRQTIENVLNAGNTGALLTKYPQFTTATEMASQMTANIADYIDEDNQVTFFFSGGKVYLGFEALPYITEVYTQRLFVAGPIVPLTPPPPAPAQDEVTWNPVAQQGFAIEIGNPFARRQGGTWQGRPVLLENVYIQIGGGTKVELSTIAGTNVLNPGEVLIIRRDSGTAADDDISKRFAAGQMKVIEADVTNDARFALAPGKQSIRLFPEIRSPGGTANPSGFPHSACDIDVPAAQIKEQVNPGAVQPNARGYACSNYQGVGDGLRMMTVTAEPKSANPRGFGDDITTVNKPSLNSDSATGVPNLSAAVSELAKADKASEPNTFASLDADDQQLILHDNPRKRMQWIGDLLQVPLIGQNANVTGNNQLMAAAFYRAAGNGNNLTNLGGGVKALMLPYKTDPSTPAAEKAPLVSVKAIPNDNAPGADFGIFEVPHAILLMDQLTTFSPVTDSEDNNGDGNGKAADDKSELLIPGKLNLNTATLETLIRALPFPDANTRLEIAQAIIERRESLGQKAIYGQGTNTVPAIAYTTSLYQQIEKLPTNPSQDRANTTNLAGTRIDYNDYETTPGSFPNSELADGIIDDREEELMLAKWLSELGETRSDVFAAYIVVQGYPAANFKGGAIESARLIVIFTRANVRDNNDRATEIARFRFK